MSLRLDPFLNCNRLVKEEWEDREYELHLKRISDIKNRKSRIDFVKFPNILNNSKRNQSIKENDEEMEKNMNILEARIDRIKFHKNVNLDNWNLDYELRNLRDNRRNRVKTELEIENERLAKKIKQTKGVYSVKKWNKDYEDHQVHVNLSEKKFYTPRGMGHRKLKSLPEMRMERNKKSKNAIKLLDEAVHQLERGDVVLMKTLVTLNYLERMDTKAKYEEAYETDLKKGLIKVMDKQYEPLINALLTDMYLVDVDKIYESLYDPSEVCVVIPEALLSRNLEQKKTLISNFETKIDSNLSDEISNKLEGDLKNFLIALVQNDNLYNEKLSDDKMKVDSDVKELSKNFSLSSELFLNIVKTYSKRQLKYFFKSYEKINGVDIFSEIDMNKATPKALKFIQIYLNDSFQYKAEKLQKNFKTNKAEFLRLLAIYPQNDLKEIIQVYNRIYKTNLDNDIKNSFSDDVSRLVLKMIHRNEFD